MNKFEEIRTILEYENANQGVFTEKQMNELRDFITSCEETETQFLTLKNICESLTSIQTTDDNAWRLIVVDRIIEYLNDLKVGTSND